ncbi:MAG: glycosyltransferase [Halofilum sp. (in: g-proteobacteria)]
MASTSPPRTMAVLYSFMNGGSERLGAAIAHYLAAEGWPVEVLATHTADGPVRRWLHDNGVPAFGMDASSESALGRRWRVFRLMRSRRIEVLHVQHFSMLALCYWPARLAGVRRIVVTEHNEQLVEVDRRTIRRSRYYGARVDLITVIHNGIRRYLVDRLRIPDAQIRTIRNGVDTERFAPAVADPAVRASLGAAEGEVLIGTVGRLHPDKNQRALLEALQYLRMEYAPSHPVKLVLIGNGDEREALEHLCARLGLSEQVQFAGDRDDIERVMPQLDLFVLPSRTEGVPLVLLEAMACGIPCVATRVGGVPELFAAGGGRLVEPGDPRELAAVLAEFVADPQAWRQLGARARAVATERHDRGGMLTAYREALVSPEGREEPRPSPQVSENGPR